MKRKFFLPALVPVMVAGLLISALPGSASPPPPDYKPVDIGPELRGWTNNGAGGLVID